jgi:DNA repair protein RecO
VLVATDSIVLRSRKQGDTSKIVTLYTRDFGLVDVIAKGARQQKSKFGAALEPFTLSKIVFYKKEHTSLYLLSAAEVITAHRNLMNDLDHIEAATQLAELLIRSQHHEEQRTELFDLVQLTIATMDMASDPNGVFSILVAFYLRYATDAGFAFSPFITSDKGNIFFDCETGELFSAANSEAISHRYILLTPQMMASLEYLNTHPIAEAGVLRIIEHSKKGLESLFRAYFSIHIEGMQANRMKAGKVFAALKR